MQMQEIKGLRWLLFFSILVILTVCITGISFQVALARAHPFRPGQLIFPIQHFAEQARAQLIPGKSEQAAYYLDLAQQRNDDLVVLVEGEHALLAVDHLNRALDQAIEAIVEAPEQDLPLLSTMLNDLVLEINAELSRFTEFLPRNNEAVEKLQAKIATLGEILAGLVGQEGIPITLNTSDEISNPPDVLSAQIDPDSSVMQPFNVEFPPGSPGAMHEFFPLEGKHAALECLDCHTDGQYAGTQNFCIDCHSDLTPDPHYIGDCSACHSPISWLEITFDHSQGDAVDCKFCHLGDKPVDHYAVQCSACHNTINWAQADFNHKAVETTDCRLCHAGQEPANHYNGQCSACHNTNNWTQATFNHQAVGATDCKSCHDGDKPSNHFSGQCSVCHNVKSWQGATFNHSAVGATDCKTCHSGDKPSNHFSGQCSACHNVKSWQEATFNHSAVGATECKSCHNSKKPSNHFSGQCSACHSTSSWSGAAFNHGAVGATDCKSCHSANKPDNHFGGQCSQCHKTSTWSGASFKHSFPMDHGDANGNCSKCHPSGGAKFNCYACHSKEKMIEEHGEEGISDIGNRCLNCHPNGQEGDEDDDDD